MIACLSMYDRPENAAAHDALWALVRDGLRARGIDAPEALERHIHHMDSWGRPDLLIGQICNMPYRALFRDRVTVLGCGDYGLPDTPPGYYHSVFVVRAEDGATPLDQALTGRLAYSEELSQSGWGAVHDFAAARGIALTPHLQTGAHVDSARAVARGAADVASIDAITWRMLKQWLPETADLRAIGRSQATPGQSFVTARSNDPEPIRAALHEAITALPDESRDILGLRGFVTHPGSAYDFPIAPPPAT